MALWFNKYYQYEMKMTKLNVSPLAPSVVDLYFYSHITAMVIQFLSSTYNTVVSQILGQTSLKYNTNFSMVHVSLVQFSIHHSCLAARAVPFVDLVSLPPFSL